MTREEVIKILKEDGCGYCTWQSINPYECENKKCELNEAFNMAIQALSQEPTFDDECQKDMDEAWEQVKTEHDPCETCGYEPCDELSQECVGSTQKHVGNALDMRCDDAISRDELLKAIDTWDKFGYTETGCFVREPKGDYVPYIHYDDVIKSIKGMPSVTQKSGKWIIDQKEGYRIWHCHCSKCNKDPQDFIGGSEDWWVIRLSDFCPNCGAKMFEPQERSDKE